jgi:HlyD family secretion protein
LPLVVCVKKRVIFFLALGLLLLAVGCWWVVGRAGPGNEQGYSLVPAEYGRAADVISATGVAQPRDVYVVGTELAGKLVEVRADFNHEVAEGDLLARIDDEPLRERAKQADLSVQEAQAGLQQAQAARDAAKTALQRVMELAPEVRRQIDLDVAQHQLKAAEAAIGVQQVKVQEAEEAKGHAQDDLKRAEVRAPVLAPPASAAAPPGQAGVGALAPANTDPPGKRTFTVLDRAVSVNQMIGPPASARLFTLAAGLNQMRIEVQVAEADVDKVARGQPADVKGPGDDSAPHFAGRVEDIRLMPTGEHGAVFYRAVVDVQNQRDAASHDWRLRPGMTADVDVLLRVHEPVWKVPAAALTFQPDPSTQTDAAKARLARWQGMKDRDLWRPVWVLGGDRMPWPVLVRTGGQNAQGQTGIQTAEYSEVLEWDPEMQPPDPSDPNTFPRAIIAAPPPQRSFLTMPTLKL